MALAPLVAAQDMAQEYLGMTPARVEELLNPTKQDLGLIRVAGKDACEAAFEDVAVLVTNRTTGVITALCMRAEHDFGCLSGRGSQAIEEIVRRHVAGSRQVHTRIFVRVGETNHEFITLDRGVQHVQRIRIA